MTELGDRELVKRCQGGDQEAFLRVYRGLPHFRGEARLVTWIYRIVANLCIEERGRRPADTMSLDEVDEHQQPRIQPSGPDREFSDLELRDRLDAAMRELSPRYRMLIAAHYLKGVRYEDLAEALGVPLGTVKTQLYRARRQLRVLLEAQCLEPSQPAATTTIEDGSDG